MADSGDYVMKDPDVTTELAFGEFPVEVVDFDDEGNPVICVDLPLKDVVKAFLDDEDDNDKESFHICLKATDLTYEQLEIMETLPSEFVDTHNFDKIEALTDAIREVMQELKPTAQDRISVGLRPRRRPLIVLTLPSQLEIPLPKT